MDIPRNVELFHSRSGGVLKTDVTLRDLFAAAALAGHPNHLDPDQDNATVARACYRLADAMLIERDQ